MNISSQSGSMLLPIPQLPTEKFERVTNPPNGEPVTRLHVRMKSNLPVRRTGGAVSPATGLASGVLRRIQQEMDNEDFDMRVVMSHCRGLRRGTSRFDDAYISGRLETLSQQRQSQSGIPHMILAEDVDGMSPGSDGARAAANPFSVTSPRDLAKFFGPWLGVILVCQVFIVWMGSTWIDGFLPGGRNFYAVVLLFAFLWVNSLIWIRNRGKHFKAFMVPGAALLSVSLLGCAILHILGKIKELS